MKFPSSREILCRKSGKRYNRLSDNAAARQVLSQYKNACAKKRGYCWELTDDQFFKLTQKNCYYCNDPPANRHCRSLAKSSYVYNGIDRLDNTIGYTIRNTVTSCMVCNNMKKGLFKGDFINQCAKITKHTSESKNA